MSMKRRSNRAGRRKRESGGDNGRDRWLITYADLITLLLIFFVMMFAMSRLDTQKYQEITQSLQVTFKTGASILDQGAGLTGTANKNTHKTPDNAAKSQQPSKKKRRRSFGSRACFPQTGTRAAKSDEGHFKIREGQQT